MTIRVDRVAQLLARLPEQFRDLPGWEGVLSDLGAEIQELEDAHVQLLTLRGINNATGATLENIGRFVGEPPIGLDEEVYRRRIRARVFTNRSRGTVEELIRIARLILAEPDGSVPHVAMQRETPATMVVEIDEDAVTTDLADVLIGFLRAATKGGASAGVRVLLETSAYPTAERFSFEGGPGLGYGTSAKMDLFTLTASADTVLMARAVGESENAIAMSFVQDVGAPNDGALTGTYPSFTFTFKNGVTTVSDFEAAVAATIDDYVAVLTPSTSPSSTLLTGVDEFTDNFTGGVDGGRYIGVRE